METTTTPPQYDGAGGEGSTSEQDLKAMLENAQAEFAKIVALVADATRSATSASAAEASAKAAALEVAAKLADAQRAAIDAQAASAGAQGNQATASTLMEQVETTKKYADDLRKPLDQAVVSAKKCAADAQAESESAKANASDATTALAQLKELLAQAGKDAEEARTSMEAAKASAAATKSLADRAASIEKRVKEYEDSLADFERRANEQFEEIKGLLPGATTAGLAHAFDERRKGFRLPSYGWQFIFMAAIVVLIAIASDALAEVSRGKTDLSYDDLFRLWLSRFPVAAALVWVALHAGREAALAQRLEEDYGYKAAIASSFQGFQKQMAEISTAQASDSPLGKLCDDTLSTLASPPGRIYDKHQLTTSPASELANTAARVRDAVTGGKGSKSAG